jgi:hypothetical protein
MNATKPFRIFLGEVGVPAHKPGGHRILDGSVQRATKLQRP